MILFGHPAGNPNSHQAALAHYEQGRLDAFCVPWMPTPAQLRALSSIPAFASWAARLERRSFPPLLTAPRIEGRAGEFVRLARRVLAGSGGAREHLSYEANDWLMRTMKLECRRPSVMAVHAYEDCSLWSFQEAKKLGKACIYDMPIGYYPAWQQKERELCSHFVEWLPPGRVSGSPFVRPEQKVREMELADLVLAPSSFVRRTIEQYVDKKVALAPYGVDTQQWHPGYFDAPEDEIRFVYAGQISIRKGIPLLLQAWEKAALPNGRLDLVGIWQLAPEKQRALPRNVFHAGPCSREELRARYQSADVFVFPSYFEGFGLVVTEALACGIPVLASDATAGPDVLDESCGRTFASGNVDELVEQLRLFHAKRDVLPQMKRAARAKAETLSWRHYRDRVSEAVAGLVQ